MKRVYFLLLGALLCGSASYAQVGIGVTTPNASSQLDVVASNKGVMIPRVSLTGTTDATTISSGNQLSLLVFNTSTVSDVYPGYYFWDGTKWARLLTGEDSATETITTLTNNGNGTFTYTDESGTTTAFPATPEPWYDQTTLAPATANTQSIYIKAPWVGIGTSAGQTVVSGERLFVQGSIRTTNSYYADYVFEDYLTGESQLKPGYNFKSLEYVEQFIQENKHLPGVTGINEVQKTSEGYAFDISSLSIQSLEKIEELFLYTIEQDKKLTNQQTEIEILKTQLKQLQDAVVQMQLKQQ